MKKGVQYFLSVWRWTPLRRMLRFLALCWLIFITLHLLFPLRSPKSTSRLLFNQKGELMHAFLTEDEQWRFPLSSSDLHPLLKKAIIAKEDQYFYYHPGVNPLSILRALWGNIGAGKTESGASTITMQTAKLLYPAKRNIWSKCHEIFRALQLEWTYSKDEILQMYLEMLPYGGNIEGIGTASMLYFGKQPYRLSLSEITCLSIVPNHPTKWKLSPQNENLKLARNRWLRKFESAAVFPQHQIEEALMEPLSMKRIQVPRMAPHLSNRLKKNAITTIDPQLQYVTEELVKNYLKNLYHKKINQAAVLVIENKTRKVRAYLGSGDFHNKLLHGQVDGIRAIRQPGSTLKPFLYGWCMDEGILYPKTVVDDIPVQFGDYAPENFDKNFGGRVTVEHALEQSLNIPAVHLLNRYGVSRFADKLAEHGLQKIGLQRKSLGLSMVLGGCGASLEELAGLFTALANQGKWHPLVYTEEDTAHHMNFSARERTMMQPESAWMLADIMSKVNRPDFPLDWEATASSPKIAWKTGTSYGRRDAWSIGFNPTYTVAVWCGNFDGTGSPYLSGAETATPLLFQIFQQLPGTQQNFWFPAPPTLSIRQVCPASGWPAGKHCGETISAYFVPDLAGDQECSVHRILYTDPEEKFRYCVYCLPSTSFKQQTILWWSDQQFQYRKNTGLAAHPIPPHNPTCLHRGAGGEKILISSLTSGHLYYLEKNSKEVIWLEASSFNPTAQVFWYQNGKLLKKAGAQEKIPLRPIEGFHQFSCVDEQGNQHSVEVEIQYY